MSHTIGERINLLLLFSTFVIAVCGLIYELLAGTISSYLLGDSVYQFSIVIGLFMASMGLGSFLSRHVEKNLPDFFVAVQIAIGAIGGTSAFLLFYAFSYLDSYSPFLLLISIGIGTLIGFEIPIVIRILRQYRILKINVSNVLTVDYVGALCASLLFPLVLVPQLGLIRTALLFGLLNVLVGGLGLIMFRAELVRPLPLTVTAALAAGSLMAGFYHADDISDFFESRLYAGEIVLAETTPYQRLVITRDRNATSLFINGALQFNTLDEYRYHEALVHPAMSITRRRTRVLILGGGDGMALREVLKYPDVQAVTLIDIDQRITELFARNEMLRSLNDNAFSDLRVAVQNIDAWKFLERRLDRYDVIIVDLPDPHDIHMSKLYTREFYTLASRRLTAEGVMITQATSPFYAREAFWCIQQTLAAVDSPYALNEQLYTIPYHAYVPSFGDWGFVLAAPRPLRWKTATVAVTTRYLTDNTLGELIRFPPDTASVETEINSLQTHKLAFYYEQGWDRWYR